MSDINQTASFSPASSEAGLSSFLVSPFSAGQSSLVYWLATSACFPFAPLFRFVCTFLSEDLSFPAAFFGFVSTFAGAGLADNLANLLLGSSFTTPSAELTFLLGIVVVGWARARCLWAAARREPSRNWAAWLLPLLPPSIVFLFSILFISSIIFIISFLLLIYGFALFFS